MTESETTLYAIKTNKGYYREERDEYPQVCAERHEATTFESKRSAEDQMLIVPEEYEPFVEAL